MKKLALVILAMFSLAVFAEGEAPQTGDTGAEASQAAPAKKHKKDKKKRKQKKNPATKDGNKAQSTHD